MCVYWLKFIEIWTSCDICFPAFGVKYFFVNPTFRSPLLLPPKYTVYRLLFLKRYLNVRNSYMSNFVQELGLTSLLVWSYLHVFFIFFLLTSHIIYIWYSSPFLIFIFCISDLHVINISVCLIVTTQYSVL